VTLAVSLVALAALAVPVWAASAAPSKKPPPLPTAPAGSWAATASMSTPRANPTATPLTDGRVLVVSGSTAELYDPTSASWTPAGTLTQARSGHVAVRLADGRVLVAGGGYSASAELYDPATNRWTPTGSMNVGRVFFTGTLLPDGRVLVVGGNSLNGLQASAELYEPSTGRWTLTGSLMTPRDSQTATLLRDGTVPGRRWPQRRLGRLAAERGAPTIPCAGAGALPER